MTPIDEVGSTRSIEISERKLKEEREERGERSGGKYSKRMIGAGKKDRRHPSGKCDEGNKKDKTTREYIVVQSQRRRTIGNEDRDSTEKDVGAIKDDSPFNS